MRRANREKMAAEVGTWANRGLIPPEVRDRLFERYDQQGAFLSGLLRWLGIFAVLQMAGALLGFIAAAAGSVILGAIFVGAGSAMAYRYGTRFATDPRQHHAFTGAVLVTVSLAGAFTTAMLLVVSMDPSRYVVSTLLVLNGFLALLVAYKHRLRWPLVLGVLQLFHSLGSYSEYGGSGGYFLDVQDPRVMSVVALLMVVLGTWHERVLEEDRLPHHAGFGGIYIKFGLFYFNVSLLILSIETRHDLPMILLFTAACVGQIVAGSRLKDGRITGFGVVFMTINLYTRVFQYLDSSTQAGWLFLSCGSVALVLGGIFEAQLRAARRVTP